MKESSHHRIPSLSGREAAFGVVAATVGALVLIAALSALASLAPRAEAKAIRTLHHRFPVPSPHRYGDGVGARRGHQGQDVFADCGKRVLAARGGRVQFRDSDGSAGNYLVVDVLGTGADYVYMHLRGNALARRGERVRTGERIGKVGQSGNAVGCHLHFELWSRPGWYEGGHFMRSVTRHLRRWDRADG
jgi:murein DD-endopeptidase MepM/ murein hydrolase activator NlpD